MTEKETVLERHCIGGHGNLLNFVRKSETYCSYQSSLEDVNGYLKKAAAIDDKEARELVLSLIGKIERLTETADELRKRFETTGVALGKINASLKEDVK